MKIVLNTTEPNAVASYAYINALKSIKNITINDFNNYGDYDVALFLTYKNDLKEIARVKKIYKKLKIGLIDPRGSEVDSVLKFLDFLIVDSLEMKDFFSKYQLPIFYYYEYPNIFIENANKNKSKKTILGYHGNKLHLIGMYPKIFNAIELLAKKYDLEFWALYNHEKLGKLDFALPKGVEFRHIQWSEKNFKDILSQVDIGLVPSAMPIKNLTQIKNKSSYLSNAFNETDDDYLLRFKMPSNAGRIISFAFLQVPVIADLIPSSCQIIKDEYNGLLAYSSGGWYSAIESLILDSDKRDRLINNMNKTKIDYSFENQNQNFIKFMENICRIEKPESAIPINLFKHRELNNISKFKFNNYLNFFKKIILKFKNKYV